MEQLKPVTTHIDPALYEAILAAKKAKKIGTLREFFAAALKAALPPAFRATLGKKAGK